MPYGVRAGVVTESVAEPEDAARRVAGDLDLVELPALVARADEVLEAVLGPLDGPAEPHRRVRDQDLLGIEEHDLRAEAAPVSGATTSTLNSGRPKIRARPFLMGSGACVELHTRSWPVRASCSATTPRAPRSGCRSSARCRAAPGSTCAARRTPRRVPTRWTTRAARFPGTSAWTSGPPAGRPPRGRRPPARARTGRRSARRRPRPRSGRPPRRTRPARPRSAPRRPRAAAGSADGSGPDAGSGEATAG